MPEELLSPPDIGGRIENTRRIETADLYLLCQEFEPLHLPQIDRNYVVPKNERNIKDKTTSNEDRQRIYLQNNLGIDTEKITTAAGKVLNESLVVETLFSWIAAAQLLKKHPERESEIIEALNSKIAVQDQKRRFVDSGALKDFTSEGLDFFRTVRSLPKGALQTMWETLTSAIEKKQAQKE